MNALAPINSGIQFDFRRTWVRMVTPYETSLMRARFSKMMRQDFRAAAAHITHTPSVYLQRHETHHIVPILLGGDNRNANLALVDPELHLALHAFINNQTGGMEPGDAREIDIPVMQGIVWPAPVWH